jgi:hypothetical protein
MEKPIDKGSAQFAADEIQRLEDRLRALWEDRLRALWDELEGERKYYEDRIKRLESKLVQIDNWYKAKEVKP